LSQRVMDSLSIDHLVQNRVARPVQFLWNQSKKAILPSQMPLPLHATITG